MGKMVWWTASTLFRSRLQISATLVGSGTTSRTISRRGSIARRKSFLARNGAPVPTCGAWLAWCSSSSRVTTCLTRNPARNTARTTTISRKWSQEIFNRKGELRNIHRLRHWALPDVLREKYHFSIEESKRISDFLFPMLELLPSERANAGGMANHAFMDGTRGMDSIKLDVEVGSRGEFMEGAASSRLRGGLFPLLLVYRQQSRITYLLWRAREGWYDDVYKSRSLPKLRRRRRRRRRKHGRAN